MPSDKWAIIGTDMFSYEDYPKEVCATREEALEKSAAYTEAQKATQPGGLSDKFSAHPLRAAANLCDMSVDDFRSFVKAMSNAQR